jgi:hypothetical protein
MLEKRNCTASFTVRKVGKNLVSQRQYLERQKPTAEAMGRIRGRKPPLPPQPVHRSWPVKRPTHSRLTAFLFVFFFFSSRVNLVQMWVGYPRPGLYVLVSAGTYLGPPNAWRPSDNLSSPLAGSCTAAVSKTMPLRRPTTRCGSPLRLILPLPPPSPSPFPFPLTPGSCNQASTLPSVLSR